MEYSAKVKIESVIPIVQKNFFLIFLKSTHTPKKAVFLTSKTHNRLTRNRKTINSTFLVPVGCGRLAEGKGHETEL